MAATPKLLVMRESDLIDDEERADQREFPTRWTQGTRCSASRTGSSRVPTTTV